MVKITANLIEKTLIIIVLIVAVGIVYHHHHKMYKQIENFNTSPIENTNGKHVLMLFFSYFCEDSRRFLPLWETLIKKYNNNSKLIVLKVDIDKDLQLANKYKAAMLPTIILQTPSNEILKYFGNNTLPEVQAFLKRNGL